ncbi:helix-turn-helix domain-containing protein [Alcaligenes phenolicus]|uniref:helix-turn-helix domain-containing protein n=1 Tax=Alcaligenes phenolicus TaxID=232846 RepID=UPI0009F2B9BF|nr:helix-turn-helix transcriptional regulator [Alcaligenes phenolicus]OQV32910.1 AraC family transcriptional regulator [Alcaligenes phenolicus]
MSALPCARLHHPSRKTASIIHLGVERDTRALDLLPQQRLNCYPASPLVVLSWVFHGQLHMVQTPVDGGSPVLSEPLPGMLFAGPSRAPPISWSPGPVHAISIGLYPDALKRVFGIEASDFLDQVLPMDQVLPAASCQTLGQAGTEEGPLFEQLEAAIHRCAHGCLATEGAATLHHWLTALGIRMAATRTGTGLRQMQRQFKRWAGQSQRELQLYVRAERAFALVQQQENPVWSDVALQAGYSDQSHFGREVKRVSGFSPAQFAQRMKSDEAFWMYRLLGEA